VVDWDLRTTLEGLYAAGGQIFANGDHAYAATSGRYAGRKAADYALGASQTAVDRHQVEAEKTRVYAPVKRSTGMDWKELNAGACRVMQDYCGELKSEEILTIGLKWFAELEAGEAASACARNPHEMSRLLEVFNIITVGQMILEGCRARPSSNPDLGFTRIDSPVINPPEWRKWVTLKMDQGKVETGELALDYYGDLKSNYEAHGGL
jgi:succinate dehydrogenase/fumarate reductase flavoprotein subunit